MVYLRFNLFVTFPFERVEDAVVLEPSLELDRRAEILLTGVLIHLLVRRVVLFLNVLAKVF